MDKKQEQQMLEHCKKAIEKSVANAGGVIAFVNHFIVVPDPFSTIRVINSAIDAVLKIDDELENDCYHFMVCKVHLEENSTLTVHLLVDDYDSGASGEVVYKNSLCTVKWDENMEFEAHSMMPFYQIP